MQLTNIARDVGEDAREGRLYLPLQWLRGAGVDPDKWLGEPVFNAAIGATVQRLLDEADVLYARSRSGIARLPIACRAGINAARLLYAEIGREIERRGQDSVTQRAVVSRSSKLRLLIASAAGSWARNQEEDRAALPEARYLIETVAAAPAPARAKMRRSNVLVGAEDRLVWVIDLFAQLEQREQFKRSSC